MNSKTGDRRGQATNIRRGGIATQIDRLISAAGASHVTLTFAATDALELAKDLRWACKSSVRTYQAEKIEGGVRDLLD